MEAGLVRQKEAAEAAKREHELALARSGQGNREDRQRDSEDRAKAPKLPLFVDKKDDLDAYLQRFERFAVTAKWHKNERASKLSALLSGRALEVYSRLSEETAKDYDKVKIALMKRSDLTEDGYRRKFRASKPEVDESPDQFIVRLNRYLLRWLELSDTAQIFDGLKVPLTPKICLLLTKSTSFPDFISEKVISIDKILAFLQAIELVSSMFTTAQSGIWVGLLVTSLREPR